MVTTANLNQYGNPDTLRIDQLLSSVSSLLTKDGKMLTTDFLRIAPAEEVAEFLTFNSMTLMLSMEEMKQAFARNGNDLFNDLA